MTRWGTHEVNVNGTLNVLQAARVNGVRRVINSSSSSVYGDQPIHVMHEEMRPNPKSSYAMQKLIGEQYCGMYARLLKLRITSLRYFNVYGPRQPAEGAYVLLIPKFLQMRSSMSRSPCTVTVTRRGDIPMSWTWSRPTFLPPQLPCQPAATRS